MRVGFIGLGSMGLPLARRLLQAGHKLSVYNRTRSRADQLKHLDSIEAPALKVGFAQADGELR